MEHDDATNALPAGTFAANRGAVRVDADGNVGSSATPGGFEHSGSGKENGLESFDGWMRTEVGWVEPTGATPDPFVSD